MDAQTLNFWLNNLAVIAFAITAVLAGEIIYSAQIFIFRACAIHWNLSVPNFLTLRSKK
jgi:NADH:ubiquinone oxidoreductase subunit 6 (subunit J)